MNIELIGKYRFPAYAANMLYLLTDTGATLLAADQRKFTADVPPDSDVRITWGAPDGPILAWWRYAGEPTVWWDGRVKVGGYIERLHAGETGGLEYVVAEVVGGPFFMDHVGLPSLHDMRGGTFARPADAEPLVDDQVYPLIMLAESNLAALAQDALVSGLAVDAYTALASDANGWHEIVGLPLLLDTLTLLAP